MQDANNLTDYAIGHALTHNLIEVLTNAHLRVFYAVM
jgi:hypothetical protein